MTQQSTDQVRTIKCATTTLVALLVILDNGGLAALVALVKLHCGKLDPNSEQTPPAMCRNNVCTNCLELIHNNCITRSSVKT